MDISVKWTASLINQARRNAPEYEDHPFQPSPIANSKTSGLEEKTKHSVGCGRLKAHLHGKERLFDRDETRRKGAEDAGLSI